MLTRAMSEMREMDDGLGAVDLEGRNKGATLLGGRTTSSDGENSPHPAPTRAPAVAPRPDVDSKRFLQE